MAIAEREKWKFRKIRNLQIGNKNKKKIMQNLLRIKALVRAEEQPRKTAENIPWFVSCGSTSSRHRFAEKIGRKLRKLHFFKSVEKFSQSNFLVNRPRNFSFLR